MFSRSGVKIASVVLSTKEVTAKEFAMTDVGDRRDDMLVLSIVDTGLARMFCLLRLGITRDDLGVEIS